MAKELSTVDKLVDQIAKLSVLEVSDLVGKLQEKLGVAATPPAVPAPTPAPGAPPEGGAEVPAAKVMATLVLTDSGGNKIAVIKALRGINPQLGLKEAKDITESTPKNILENVKMEEAQQAREKLEAVGAKVELK